MDKIADSELTEAERLRRDLRWAIEATRHAHARHRTLMRAFVGLAVLLGAPLVFLSIAMVELQWAVNRQDPATLRGSWVTINAEGARPACEPTTRGALFRAAEGVEYYCEQTSPGVYNWLLVLGGAAHVFNTTEVQNAGGGTTTTYSGTFSIAGSKTLADVPLNQVMNGSPGSIQSIRSVKLAPEFRFTP